MKEQLINILKTFGYIVRLQGSFAEDERYPESFFTIWNNDTPEGAHYDNDTIAFIWNFTVNFYSVDPVLVNTIPERVRSALKKDGWIVYGKGYDVPSDEPTHTGRALDTVYIENNVIQGG